MLQMTAAVENRTIRDPTAVPKTFAASLAPNAQPRNKPLVRKIRTEISMVWSGSDRPLDDVDRQSIGNVLCPVCYIIDVFDETAQMHLVADAQFRFKD